MTYSQKAFTYIFIANYAEFSFQLNYFELTCVIKISSIIKALLIIAPKPISKYVISVVRSWTHLNDELL